MAVHPCRSMILSLPRRRADAGPTGTNAIYRLVRIVSDLRPTAPGGPGAGVANQCPDLTISDGCCLNEPDAVRTPRGVGHCGRATHQLRLPHRVARRRWLSVRDF